MCCCWSHCLAGEQPDAVCDGADTAYRKLVSLQAWMGLSVRVSLNGKGCGIENAKHWASD